MAEPNIPANAINLPVHPLLAAAAAAGYTYEDWRVTKASTLTTQEQKWLKKLQDHGIRPADHAAVSKIVGKVLLEHIDKVYISCFVDDDEWMTLLSSFFPPPGALPNAEVLHILDEYTAIHTPEEVRAARASAAKEALAGGGAPDAAGGAKTIVVTTTAEKEKQERSIVIGKVRFPKLSAAPYDCIYPHHWLTILHQNGSTVAKEAWHRSLSQLFQGCVVPEVLRPRQERTLLAITLWFVEAPRPPQGGNLKDYMDSFTGDRIRLWFAHIEDILELWLLSGIRLSGSQGTATSRFNAACTAAWAGGDPLEYYKYLTDARAAIDTRKAPPPAPGSKNPFRRY